MRSRPTVDIAICLTPTVAVVAIAVLSGAFSRPNSRISEVPPALETTVANPVVVETAEPPEVIPIPTTIAAIAISPAVLRHQLFDSATDVPPRVEPVTSANPVPPTPVPPAPQSTDVRLSDEEISALRARGDALLRTGDIASARLFYERAAESGDGPAALRLGETYDPSFLKSAGISGIRGDSRMAKHWYQRASELGASEAQVLLKSTTDK